MLVTLPVKVQVILSNLIKNYVFIKPEQFKVMELLAKDPPAVCKQMGPTPVGVVACKLTVLMLTVFFLQASSIAQTVTLSVKNVPIETIFKTIKKQTGFTFLGKTALLKKGNKVTVTLKEVDLKEALDACFRDQPFTWSIEGRIISILPKPVEPVEKPRNSYDGLLKIDVRGRVMNDKGEPAAGVTVTVKGTATATATDADGNFMLAGIDSKATLIITGVTIETYELKVNDRAILKVTVQQKTNELDQAVVIAYGTTTKRLNTGSVVSVKAEDIAKQPVANPLSALQGRMTGVLVTNGRGLPGSNVKVQIRGINSITSGKDPLYIIDGVPFSSTPLNSFNGALVGANDNLSPFNSINPTDIESIDVLKDADATAIYGSRAANGVVLITTKKGKAGDTKVELTMYTGANRASTLQETLSTEQYLALRKLAFTNDGVVPTVANARELLVFDQNQYTNFQKMVIGNTARLSDFQVSMSGGSENTRFRLGGNYRNEGTIYPGDLSYVRGGGSLNLEHSAMNQKFQASIAVAYSADKNKNLSSLISYVYAPNCPIYDAAGKFNFLGAGNIAAFALQKSRTETKFITSNAALRYKILPNLNLKANVGYNNGQSYTFLSYPKASLDPNGSLPPISKARYGNSTVSNYSIEPQLDYTTSVGNGKLQALLGGSWQYATMYGTFIAAENYPNDNLLENLYSAGNISNTYPKGTSSSQYKYVSVFTRVNYNWKDKYIINASIRRDGSSRFGPGNEFGNFGAGGIAWLFSNEEFIQRTLPVLSFGKLRGSYGIIGNDQIRDYEFLPTYGAGEPYQQTSGLEPNRIANPDYRWERNRKLEAALDLGFFKDRILLNIAWFSTRSDNQLVGYALPSQTGFSSYQANLPALIENKGWEFSLNTVNIRSKDFNWQTSFNLTTLSNKLLEFPGLAFSSYKDTYVIGQSISLFKAFRYLGVDPQTGIPTFANAKGEVTTNLSSTTDMVSVGKTLPDYFGGISNTFTYKGIQLDVFFQFVKQEGIAPTYWPGYSPFAPVDALNYWQKPGDLTNNPKPTTGNANNDAAKAIFPYTWSSRFWGDASYLRLRNLSLSYSLPAVWIQKISIRQLRFYLQGQNLLTITNYKGTDPEFPGKTYTVPTLKTITFGLQATF